MLAPYIIQAQNRIWVIHQDLWLFLHHPIMARVAWSILSSGVPLRKIWNPLPKKQVYGLEASL